MIDTFLSIYLPRFFDWVIETSIMASILVGLILFVKTILRNKLTARWHYLLWLILIVRLLLPWSPDSQYSIYSLLSNGYKMATSTQTTQLTNPLEQESINEKIVMPTKKVVREEEPRVTNIHPIVKDDNKETVSNSNKQEAPISFYTIALYIWL